MSKNSKNFPIYQIILYPDKHIDVYIFGQLKSTSTESLSDNCCNDNSKHKLIFGAEYTNKLHSNLGTAKIHNLMIFNRALDSEEMSDIDKDLGYYLRWLPIIIGDL